MILILSSPLVSIILNIYLLSMSLFDSNFIYAEEILRVNREFK